MKKIVCVVAIVLLVLTGYSLFVPGKITAEQSKDNSEATFTSSKKFKIKDIYISTPDKIDLTDIDDNNIFLKIIDVDDNSYTLKYNDSTFAEFSEFNDEYQDCNIEYYSNSFKDDDGTITLCEITYSNPKNSSLRSTKKIKVEATVENRFSVVWLIDAVVLLAAAIFFAINIHTPQDRSDLIRDSRGKQAFVEATTRNALRNAGK